MLLFFIIYLVKPENHNQWLRLEKLDRDERSVKNDGRCEIGGQMGIPGCNFFSGLRFSHQLLLPSGTTFHIMSLSLWLLILIFLSLLKLLDTNTQMGVWRFSSMVERGLWFWKQWHMTNTVSWPTSWQHISFTLLALPVLSLVFMPLSPTLYPLICFLQLLVFLFCFVSLTLSIRNKK